MASEGSREIAAAKQRVAAAKAQKAAASKMVASADEMAKEARHLSATAKAMAETAKKQADTAKKNKLTAKTLLESSSKELEEAEKLLRESEQRWEVIDVDTPVKKRKKTTTPTEREKPPPEASTDINAVSSIEVEGSGLLEVNGNYKKKGTVFTKRGQWNNKTVDFDIYHRDRKWFIGTEGYVTFYRTMNNALSELPSENGWITVGRGDSPAPQLKCVMG